VAVVGTLMVALATLRLNTGDLEGCSIL